MCVAAVAKTLPERVAADNSAGVKATPGTLQDGGASFATTHWSIVAQSAFTNVPEAENALAKLCETYWPPIYSFICRRGYAPADAQYLTYSFFEFFPTKQSLCARGSPSGHIPFFSSRVCKIFSLGQRVIRHSEFGTSRRPG
jgi:hypothetical protein